MDFFIEKDRSFLSLQSTHFVSLKRYIFLSIKFSIVSRYVYPFQFMNLSTDSDGTYVFESMKQFLLRTIFVFFYLYPDIIFSSCMFLSKSIFQPSCLFQKQKSQSPAHGRHITAPCVTFTTANHSGSEKTRVCHSIGPLLSQKKNWRPKFGPELAAKCIP